jgi:hypothetical protein
MLAESSGYRMVHKESKERQNLGGKPDSPQAAIPEQGRRERNAEQSDQRKESLDGIIPGGHSREFVSLWMCGTRCRCGARVARVTVGSFCYVPGRVLVGVYCIGQGAARELAWV